MKKIISKIITTSLIYYRVYDRNTHKLETLMDSRNGVVKDSIRVRKSLQNKLPENMKLVDIENIDVVSKRYYMLEEEFVRFAREDKSSIKGE